MIRGCWGCGFRVRLRAPPVAGLMLRTGWASCDTVSWTEELGLDWIHSFKVRDEKGCVCVCVSIITRLSLCPSGGSESGIILRLGYFGTFA